jgi:hypothetical protein
MASLVLLAGVMLATGFTLHRNPRKPYLEAYAAQTRHLVLYWDFQTSLNLRATYLSHAFRERIAAERTRAIHPPAEDQERFLKSLRDDDAAYHEIVFSADSGIDDFPEFGTNEKGWILRLEADGVDQPLVTAYRVHKPNPLQKALYPHFNIWSHLWIARFERVTPDPDRIVLHVGSGYGNGDLTWEAVRSTGGADASAPP